MKCEINSTFDFESEFCLFVICDTVRFVFLAYSSLKVCSAEEFNALRAPLGAVAVCRWVCMK